MIRWIKKTEVVVKKAHIEGTMKQLDLLTAYAAVLKSRDRIQNKIVIAFVILVLAAIAIEFLQTKKKS